MGSIRFLAVVMLAAALATACGDDDTGDAVDTTAVDTTATTEGDDSTTTEGDDSTTTEGDDTTTTEGDGDTTSTTGVTLEQPAIWPAPGVVFDSPEEAAEDFVTELLDVPATLGEFMQGDARSGEIEVVFAGEDGSGPETSRSLLLMRQLGPDNGWYVLAAVNPNASITSPESGSTVEAGTITVEGEARGFEGTVLLSAHPAGDADNQLDFVVTQGGSLADPAPYGEELDLSGAEPGSTVVLLVRGGVGLEIDPGDFGAIPVVIAG